MKSMRLLHHRNIGDGNKFHVPTGFIVDQRFSIFCEEAMFRFFNPNNSAIVEPQRIRLEWPAVFNVQKNLFGHVAIVRDPRRNVKFGQIALPFFQNKN